MREKISSLILTHNAVSHAVFMGPAMRQNDGKALDLHG
jgi:hypothetical protein